MTRKFNLSGNGQTGSSQFETMRQVAQLIRAGEEWSNHGESFRGSARRGWVLRNEAPHAGYMSRESRELMDAAARIHGIDYVIWSYQTPIAYRLRTTGAWIVPTDTYSITTARHQSTLWSILRALGVDTSFEWVPDVSAKTGRPLKSRAHREQTVFA